MRRIFGLMIFLFSGFFGFAQKPHSLLDTIELGEVVTIGELRKFQPGAKITPISAKQIELAESGGIENVIRRFSPVYIKSDAGGLSTIHIRGTSASHTTINYGGININSLTLGQTNLSGVPLFLFDGLNLQYGSSSTINGSGAVGGAVYLSLSENWTDGLRISAKTTVGSFGELMTGAKVYTGNGNLESVTRIYFYQKENDFPFNNYYTGNVESPGPLRDVQHGASVGKMGLLQELNYRFSKNQFIRSSVWAGNNTYQVQQNMQTNWHYNGTQQISDDNLRLWAEHNNNENNLKFRSGAGFVHDLQVYDSNEDQQIGTNRIVAEAEVSAGFNSGFSFKTGATYKYINPNVYTYSDSVIDFEQHLDLYLSSFYQITRDFKISLNLRQQFVTNFQAPFTPSFGAEYFVRTGRLSYLKFASALARSYRVPTFNDRYWGTQGNPDLKPESGKNAEVGIQFYTGDNNCNTSAGITAFWMDVENWIEWRNFGEWQAQNVLEVVSQGIEFQSNTCITVGKTALSATLNYTFNPVEPVKNLDENGLLNRQMNYTPLHSGNASFDVHYKNWRFFADGQFTGERYTDDFGHTVAAFFVANSGAAYEFDIKKQVFGITLSVNNVLDADYQNEKYYAMPGRSYHVNLKYDFNHIK